MASAGGHTRPGPIVECPLRVDTVTMALRRLALVVSLSASVTAAAGAAYALGARITTADALP